MAAFLSLNRTAARRLAALAVTLTSCGICSDAIAIDAVHVRTTQLGLASKFNLEFNPFPTLAENTGRCPAAPNSGRLLAAITTSDGGLLGEFESEDVCAGAWLPPYANWRTVEGDSFTRCFLRDGGTRECGQYRDYSLDFGAVRLFVRAMPLAPSIEMRFPNLTYSKLLTPYFRGVRKDPKAFRASYWVTVKYDGKRILRRKLVPSGVKWVASTRKWVPSTRRWVRSTRRRVPSTLRFHKAQWGYEPQHRAYEGSDAYWNTCIVERRRIWMSNGRKYCVLWGGFSYLKRRAYWSGRDEHWVGRSGHWVGRSGHWVGQHGHWTGPTRVWVRSA